MEISKELQVNILEYLKLFSGLPTPESFEADIIAIAADGLTAYQALKFLIDEGLVLGKVVWRGELMYSKIEISSAGLKSIAKESIGAEQAIVMNLHPDTLAFLSVLVRQRDLTAEKKSGLLSAFRNIPSAALEETVKQIVAVGMRYLQGLMLPR